MEPACALRLSDDRAGGDRGTVGRVELRLSGGDEAELLAAVQEAASLAGLGHIFPPEHYPYPIDEVVARWRGFEGVVVVAERDGNPVGVAATADCWLHGLYAIPEEWGGGVAELLHEDALDRIRAAVPRLASGVSRRT